MAITHTKVSAKADGADTSEVRPSDWNADHTGSISDLTADFKLTADISPTALSAAVNDYDPTGLSTASVLRLTTNSSTQRNITGLAGGADGRILLIHNAGGPGNIALVDESASSTAADRFALAGDVIIAVDRSVLIQYDSTSLRWRAIGGATAATTNAVVLGTAVARGTSPYFLGADDTIVAFDATTPPAIGTAATGSAAVASRRDHVHPFATQADQTFLGNISGGTAIPSALTAAQVITAITGQVGGLPVIGELASDFLFTVSNTTPQSITGLSFTIGASATEIWLFEAWLEVGAVNTTMDMKFGFATMPSSATMRWGFGAWVGGSSAAGAGYSTGPANFAITGVATESTLFPTGGLNGITGVSLVGKVYGGGTSGTIQLQGAQNTSDSGQLTAKAGSVLRATKIKA